MDFGRLIRHSALSWLFVALGGYRFGTGDHVSQLPTVLHFFDPRLYSTDFSHQMIFPWYVKSALFIGLAWISKVASIPLEYLFFGVYFAVVLLYVSSFDELLGLVGVEEKNRLLLLLLLLPYSYLYGSISHFHLVTLRLVPYFFVLPLCMKAVSFYLKGRFTAASLLSALVFYLHQQLGLILFGALFFAAATEAFRDTGAGRRLASMAAPFAVLFSLHFTFMQILGSYRGYPWFDTSWGAQLLEMVRFRVPHHLLLSYSGFVEKASFALSLVLVFVTAPRLVEAKAGPAVARRISAVTAALLLACIAGWVFTELVPLPVVFSLYLFRSDVLIRVLSFACAALWIQRLVEGRQTDRAARILFVVMAAASLVVCIVKDNIRIFTPRTELVSISECIREKTPVSAFIMASPALKGLRLYSQRSVFVSWKSHGLFFPPPVAREWYRRARLLCGMEEAVTCQGTPCRKACQKNFEGMSNRRLLTVAWSSGVDYLLVGRGRTMTGEKVCENSRFALYRLRRDGHHDVDH